MGIGWTISGRAFRPRHWPSWTSPSARGTSSRGVRDDSSGSSFRASSARDSSLFASSTDACDTPGSMRFHRLLLVVNPVARTVSKPTLAVIEKALSADFLLEVAETKGKGHASELAAQAVADGIDLVVVFSGDGTINEAVNALAGTEVALGVLPGGGTPFPSLSVMVGRTDPYTFYKEHGLRMTPDASLDSGLDVLSVRKLNRRNIPRIAWQVFGSARHVHGRDIDYIHDASQVVLTSSDPFPVQVDGDPLGDHRRLQIDMAREALWVVA